MKIKIVKIYLAAAALTFSAASVACADNSIFGIAQQFIIPPFSGPNSENYSTITNNGEVSGNWSVYGVSVSSYAFYGINRASANMSYPNPDWHDAIGGYAQSTSSETFVITGSSGNIAYFRFRVHWDSQFDGASYLPGGSWSIGGTDQPHHQHFIYGETNVDISFDGVVVFTNGIPFTITRSIDVRLQDGGLKNANLEMRLTTVLLPPGATIAPTPDPGVGADWRSNNIAIISPSLTIRPSNTNVVLHWFAFSDCILETTTNLSDSTAWTQVTNYVPAKTGEMEYTLSHPMDVPARFFRLRKLTP